MGCGVRVHGWAPFLETAARACQDASLGGPGCPCKALPALIPGKVSAFLNRLKTGGRFCRPEPRLAAGDAAPGTAPSSGLCAEMAPGRTDISTEQVLRACAPVSERGSHV